jgi:hypothetical protein
MVLYDTYFMEIDTLRPHRRNKIHKVMLDNKNLLVPYTVH